MNEQCILGHNKAPINIRKEVKNKFIHIVMYKLTENGILKNIENQF